MAFPPSRTDWVSGFPGRTDL